MNIRVHGITEIDIPLYSRFASSLFVMIRHFEFGINPWSLVKALVSRSRVSIYQELANLLGLQVFRKEHKYVKIVLRTRQKWIRIVFCMY